jgi:hypothetical protein
MTTSFRTLTAAAFLLLPAVLAAQEQEQPTSVGAPELRDFSIGGTRTTPPAQQQLTPAAPAPVNPVEGQQPAATATPQTPAQVAPRPRQVTPRPAAPSQAAPVPQAPPPAGSASPTLAPDFGFTPPVPEAPATINEAARAAPAEEAEPAAESASSNLLWPAMGGGALLLLGLLLILRRRRSRREPVDIVVEPIEHEAEAVPVRPRPMPILPKEEEELGPVIDLEFKAERMVATDQHAAVQFGLMVRNSGPSAARNVRIEARMFNASKFQDQEIAAFLASPGQSDQASAALSLQPQHFSQFRSQVVMPREQIRQIVIQDRPFFIPTVVVRILYQWGRGRSDQVHGTFLIGIENPSSPDKMGPFRLELGPRIYRSVGARRIDRAAARPARAA